MVSSDKSNAKCIFIPSYRERASEARTSSSKRITIDFTLMYDLLEVDCGAVKMHDSECKDEEEDRARIGEMLKKQLHVSYSSSQGPQGVCNLWDIRLRQ